MNPLPLVLAELRRSPLGCAAIVLLIALGTTFGVVIGATERAVRHAGTLAAERFDLIVGAAGSPTQLVLTTVFLQPAPLDLLPAGTLRQIAIEPGVQSVAPVAVTDSYRGYSVVGTTAAFAGSPGMAEGRNFVRANEAVAGADVNLPLGQSFHPTHGSAAENILDAHDHALDVTIVGRLRRSGTPWDRAIIVPIEAVWTMHDEDAQHPRVPAVVVTPRSVADAYQLRAKYRTAGTVALFPAEVLLPLYALLGGVRELMGTMALAFDVLLIAAVLLIIVAVLAGRRQGIGVLRALGAPPGFVLATVWLEGAMLIALGVAIGALLCAPVLNAVSAYASLRTGLAIDATLGAPEVVILCGALVAASVVAVLPALFLLGRPVAGLLQS